MKKFFITLLVASLLFSSMTTTFAQTDEPSTWATDAISEMKGYKEFRSEAFKEYKEGISRLDFIYLAVRTYELIDGKEIVVDPSISFDDTNDVYALKGATVGITSGVGNGKFGTGGLDREQLATFMVRIYQLLELDLNEASTEKFDDDEAISSWAKNSIYLARDNNILSGVGSNKVEPRGLASIEMAIVISNRILKNNGYVGSEEKKDSYLNRDYNYWGNLREDKILSEIINSFTEDNYKDNSYFNGGKIVFGGQEIDSYGDMSVWGVEEELKLVININEANKFSDLIHSLLNHWQINSDEIHKALYDRINTNSFEDNVWYKTTDSIEYKIEKSYSYVYLLIKKEEKTVDLARDYVNTNKLNECQGYWSNLTNDEVLLDLVKKASSVNDTAFSDYAINIGVSTLLQNGSLHVNSSSDELEFTITSFRDAFVQSTLKTLLNYWTLDGAFIYNQYSDDFTFEKDQWFTGPEGTEIMFTSKYYGNIIRIKKQAALTSCDDQPVSETNYENVSKMGESKFFWENLALEPQISDIIKEAEESMDVYVANDVINFGSTEPFVMKGSLGIATLLYYDYMAIEINDLKSQQILGYTKDILIYLTKDGSHIYDAVMNNTYVEKELYRAPNGTEYKVIDVNNSKRIIIMKR